jgi:trehalose 6-phosphate synthase/phosphatase
MVRNQTFSLIYAHSYPGSIIVNPWNTEDLAESIYEAVSMPDDLRKSNHRNLFRYVSKYTASYWGLSFVKELKVYKITCIILE